MSTPCPEWYQAMLADRDAERGALRAENEALRADLAEAVRALGAADRSTDHAQNAAHALRAENAALRRALELAQASIREFRRPGCDLTRAEGRELSRAQDAAIPVLEYVRAALARRGSV